MSDVRLTATNPADSSVVPVACNEKGELLLEEPTLSSDDYVKVIGDNMTGALTIGPDDGSAVTTLAENGNVIAQGVISAAAGLQSNAYTGRPVNITTTTGGIERAFVVSDSGAYPVSINMDGSATFAGQVTAYGGIAVGNPGVQLGQGYIGVRSARSDSGQPILDFANSSNTIVHQVNADGSATFAGDVVIGSRGEQWMIVESGGIAHLIKQTAFEANELDAQGNDYPELRNLPAELTMVEQQLQAVMEKLRMVPEAGWEVWDGSDEN